jgi:hypothetical protein
MKSDPLNRKIVQLTRGSFLVAVALMATSARVHAQTSVEPGAHQVTRAEVLHELEELESVGYNPATGDDPNYPADLQAALHKLEVKHQVERDPLTGVARAAQAKATP